MDTALRDALMRGARRLVILGAGFDGRAWRVEELRLCEKRGRLAKNPIGAQQLEVFPLELAEALAIVARQAGARAGITLGLAGAYPVPQCLRRTPDLFRN